MTAMKIVVVALRITDQMPFGDYNKPVGSLTFSLVGSLFSFLMGCSVTIAQLIFDSASSGLYPGSPVMRDKSVSRSETDIMRLYESCVPRSNRGGNMRNRRMPVWSTW